MATKMPKVVGSLAMLLLGRPGRTGRTGRTENSTNDSPDDGTDAGVEEVTDQSTTDGSGYYSVTFEVAVLSAVKRAGDGFVGTAAAVAQMRAAPGRPLSVRQVYSFLLTGARKIRAPSRVNHEALHMVSPRER